MLQHKERDVFNRVVEKYVPKNTSKPDKKPTDQNISLAGQAFKAVTDDAELYFSRWAKSTRKAAFSYFRLNILPFVEGHQQDVLRTDVEELYANLVQKALTNGNSLKEDSQARSIANSHLADAVIIYGAMMNYDKNLMPIDFTPFGGGRGVRPEMAKSLPQDVRDEFTHRLETLADSEPEMVFGAVLMFDGGLRTAEAAAVWPDDIVVRDGYRAVTVQYQERDGMKDSALKSNDAYRNVPLSEWALEMVQRCASIIGSKPEENKKALSRARNLSAWIREQLQECGADSKLEQAAYQLMSYEPDPDFDDNPTTDVTAYILRRDRASRWDDTCGLTSKEIDYYLGHAQDDPIRKYSRYGRPEYLKEVSKKLEQYVYNAEYSKHPGLEPISITEDKGEIKGSLSGKSRFRNDRDDPVLVIVTFSAALNGETVSMSGPKGGYQLGYCSDQVDYGKKPRESVGLQSMKYWGGSG